MKRTSAVTLVLLGAICTVACGLLEVALAAAGRPIFLPPLTLGLALLVIGILIVVLALPIRRMTQGKSSQPIDPFYATRVLVLAKASALSGAVGTGVGAGVTIFLLTRSIIPDIASLSLPIITLVGAICLLIGGLVAEMMCTIPPDDDDDDDDSNGKRAVRAEF